VASLPGVDPSRVYLTGRGAGGTLALLAAMVPSPYAAIAAIEGMPDPAALLDHRGLAPFDAHNSQERLLRTPLAFTDSLRVPLLLCYGAADPAQAAGTRLAHEATLLGKNCRLETLEGDLRATPGPAIQKSLEFLQKTSLETP
jgi:dienelactone hydrolase